MPTVMEDTMIGAEFQNILSEIEKSMTTLTVVRYGKPVARIIPVRQKRKIEPILGFSEKIKIKCDLFADDSEIWENA